MWRLRYTITIRGNVDILSDSIHIESLQQYRVTRDGAMLEYLWFILMLFSTGLVITVSFKYRFLLVTYFKYTVLNTKGCLLFNIALYLIKVAEKNEYLLKSTLVVLLL